jgi:tRNA G18 (ribose-2'-O)-methylase SpoU
LKEQGDTFFILEPQGGVGLHKAEFSKKSALIFGNEELEISFEKDDYPEIQRLKIQQHSNIDSLNVSIAASIVMYQYCVSNHI